MPVNRLRNDGGAISEINVGASNSGYANSKTTYKMEYHK